MTKMNSLLINFNILDQLGITIDEFLLLYKLHIQNIVSDNTLLEDLQKKQLIKIGDDNTVVLREKAKELLELSQVDSDLKFDMTKQILIKSPRIINQIVEDRVHEYRDKWAIKTGARGSLKSCKEKLKKWMKENPDYNFDQILEASDIYLKTEGSNLKYLQRADYFISKNVGGVESSRLSAYIDEIDEYKEEGWSNTLK